MQKGVRKHSAWMVHIGWWLESDQRGNFLEIEHSQSIKSHHKHSPWVKPYYYDEDDVVQKLSPSNFWGSSYFSEGTKVEKLMIMITLIRFKCIMMLISISYVMKQWIGLIFLEVRSKSHTSNRNPLAHTVDLRRILTKVQNPRLMR